MFNKMNVVRFTTKSKLLGLLFIGGLCLWTLVYFDVHPKKIGYFIFELPRVIFAAYNLPSVSIQSIKDEVVSGETMIRITLVVDGRNSLILLTPTAKSFSGGGPINIISIGKCNMGGLSVTGKNWEYKNLKFVTNTIQDVITHYEDIQRISLNTGLCGYAGLILFETDFGL